MENVSDIRGLLFKRPTVGQLPYSMEKPSTGSLWTPVGLGRGESVVFPLIRQRSHRVYAQRWPEVRESLPPTTHLPPSPALVPPPPAALLPAISCCSSITSSLLQNQQTLPHHPRGHLPSECGSPAQERMPGSCVQEFRHVGQLRRAPGRHPAGTVSPGLSLNLLLFKETTFS